METEEAWSAGQVLAVSGASGESQEGSVRAEAGRPAAALVWGGVGWGRVR